MSPLFSDSVKFAAIDFETADQKRDSACAVGMVMVQDGRIVDRAYQLIRPPRKKFSPFCVRVHHIHWEDVADQPSFGDYWPEMRRFLQGADFFTAHNASFDRSVLNSCCSMVGVEAPVQPFLCTVSLSRSTWSLPRNKLPDVCAHLDIPLDHHHAASDAEACARIAIQGLADNPGYLERVLPKVGGCS